MRIIQLIGLLALALGALAHPATAQKIPTTPLQLLADLNPGTLGDLSNTHCAFGDGVLFQLATLGSGPLGSGSLVSDGAAERSFQLDIPAGACADQAFFQGSTYFAGFDETHGSEIWRSDGTPDGTALVADLEPGSADSAPRGFAVLNEQLFFFAMRSGVVGLWQYNGGVAPVLLATVGNLSSNMVQLGGALYFIVAGYNVQTQTYISWLMRSDGTAAGTVRIADADAYKLYHVGDRLFFTSPTSSNIADRQLWASDGSAQGTRMVFTATDSPAQAGAPTQIGHVIPPASTIRDLHIAGERMLFNVAFGPKTGLWLSDGTALGTTQLSQEQALSMASSADGASIFFQTSAGLYRSDGTVAGTRRLLEGDAAVVGLVGAQLFYSLPTTPGGPLSLWRYHTATGVSLRLADYRNPGLLSAAFGERLLFSNCDAQHGCEPWLSDGTAAGTGLLLDMSPGPSQGLVGFDLPHQPAFLVVGGRAFFFADNGVSGREPYATDGTAAGTRLLLDTNRQPASSSPTAMVADGERLFFLARPSTSAAYHLFRVDASGARTDTLMRAANEVLSLDVDLEVAPVAGVAGGRYLVYTGRPDYGSIFTQRIWASDGTAAGTELLATKDAQGRLPYNLAFANGRAMFYTSRYDAIPASQLFVTDGTRDGTTLLRESNAIFTLQVVGDSFFIIESAVGQHNLWKSDGTVAGTRLVKSLPVEGSNFRWVRHTATAGGLLYFTLFDNGSLLWRSDGTPEGTFQLTAFPVDIEYVFGGGERLFFSQTGYPDLNTQLWSSDGSIAGTRQLRGTSLQSSAIVQGAAAGDRLYFTESAFSDDTLRMVDGVGSPITLLDLSPIDPSSNPEADFSLLGVFEGDLLFSVRNHPQAGLWRSDGTPEGTRKIQPEVATQALTINGGMVLAASDAAHGQELWGAAEGGGMIVAPALTGAQPGGSALLNLVAYGGSPAAALAAASSLTLTVELDPLLSYLSSDGPQPLIEGDQLQFNLAGAGLLGNRAELSLRLGLPADAPLGTRYAVRITVDGREQVVELMAARLLYLPMVRR